MVTNIPDPVWDDIDIQQIPLSRNEPPMINDRVSEILNIWWKDMNFSDFLKSIWINEPYKWDYADDIIGFRPTYNYKPYLSDKLRAWFIKNPRERENTALIRLIEDNFISYENFLRSDRWWSLIDIGYILWLKDWEEVQFITADDKMLEIKRDLINAFRNNDWKEFLDIEREFRTVWSSFSYDSSSRPLLKIINEFSAVRLDPELIWYAQEYFELHDWPLNFTFDPWSFQDSPLLFISSLFIERSKLLQAIKNTSYFPNIDLLTAICGRELVIKLTHESDEVIVKLFKSIGIFLEYSINESK